MTKITLILSGLFLILLAPLSTALLCFLMLGRIIPGEMAAYLQLFIQVTILLIFNLLIWKRLNSFGKSHQFKAWFIAGLLTILIMSSVLMPSLLFTHVGFDPTDTLNNEIANWSNSGGRGEFKFSAYGKINVAFFSAVFLVVKNWPLFAALYYCAKGPKSPRGKNPFTRKPVPAK